MIQAHISDINPSESFNSEVFKTTIYEKQSLSFIEPLWKQLEQEVDQVGLSCKWDWIQAWLHNYGDVIDYWFVVGTVHSTVCGIALITKETNRPLPIPVKSFHIGTNGEPYQDMVRMVNNRILVKKEYKNHFISGIIESVFSHFRWEEIVFDLYNEQEADEIKTVLSTKNIHLTVDAEPCWLFDLDEPRKYNSDVLKQYSHSTRYAIRKTLFALDNNVTIEWAETVDQAQDILDELIVLYNKKWQRKGAKGMFASKRFLSFQKEIITKFLPTGNVILFRVKNPKLGTIGCLYLLVDNGVAYGYQIGLDDFEDLQFPTINRKHFKPGFLLHYLCTEECLKRGLKAYNFSTGYYPYKKVLTNKEDSVVTLYIRRYIKPFLRENIMKFHYKLIHNKTATTLLRPFRMRG